MSPTRRSRDVPRSAASVVARESFFVASAAVIIVSEAAHGDFCDLISDFFDPDGILF